MLPQKIPRTNPDALSRCIDSIPSVVEDRKAQNENTKADTALAYEVDLALWKDATFRAIDYDNIEARVSAGIVNLYGHVSGLTNQHRAERALQAIPGLLGVNNYLIPDDRLLAEVATALGSLEHPYACKFLTGVSHGVVLLNGNVRSVEVSLLAEKLVSTNPNVRGVINSIQVQGMEMNPPDKPFLQPVIGEEIFFIKGNSGIVRQVIVNPDNRRVIAMTIWGRFTGQHQDLESLNNDEASHPERLIVISMDLVRYLTKISGFLNIKINEKNKYEEFDPRSFSTPTADWVPPYPYCSEDILFPIGSEESIEQLIVGVQITQLQRNA